MSKKLSSSIGGIGVLALLGVPFVVRKPLMEPREEAMVEKGFCPKCSDSLIRTSEGPEVRLRQCMGCYNIFALKA